MKRWKVTFIALPLLVAGVGIGSWQYRLQLKALGASALTRATTVYRAVASRWGFPVPAAMRVQTAGSARAGDKGVGSQAGPSHGEATQGGSTMPSVSKGSGEHAGHEAAAKPKAGADRAMPSTAPEAIMVTPEKQQLTGVTTDTVKRKPLVTVIRTVGIVEADETRIAHVHTKIAGWIEELHVDYTGKFVEKGQLLFTLYSPELVATQEEYLLALKARDYLGDSPFQEVAGGGRSVLKATRRRLKLWDISDEQIEELERTGQPKISIAFYSPSSGYVTEKRALRGMTVTTGMPLYTITDLSKVWILADIYESEIPLVSLGQEATGTINSYPGKVFPAKVVYIYPYLESATRTVKIRLELDNPDMKLKPKMFANVEIKVDLGQQLAVPEGAILDSGSRQIAFVALGKGHFEPREVTLGPKVGREYVVLKGLKEGERVVTSATFLIDSESQLKSAIGGMGGHQQH